jgi:dTMP kinase
MRGRFITVEGIEGAGKTTNLKFIEAYLHAQGITVLTTREPGGTPLAEQIRGLLLDHQQTGLASDTETLLLFAARAEHLDKLISPALDNGKWVLCDRFTDATYAYQGGGRGISPLRINLLEQWVQGDLSPDLTLLFDVPVSLGLERAARRNKPDRFESEQVAFFERVREAYLEQARQHSQRYRIIDAAQPQEAVQKNIQHILAGFLT